MTDPFPDESARRRAELTAPILYLGMTRRIPLAVLLAALGGSSSMDAPAARAESPSLPDTAKHRELGVVRWLRDFDAALAESTRTGKPLLVLFDEVPGCHTCISFGDTVLRHPLIVEAAEDLFVPVAIFNNAEGPDKRVLESFNEPAWNNPVVRIIDARRTDLAPRVDGDYTTRGVVLAMAGALRKTGRPVPGYLALLEEDARAKEPEKACFAMHCFWEGEAKLGAIEGVVRTRTAMLDGAEVVEVSFDPSRLDFAALVKKAKEMSCASAVYCTDPARVHGARTIVGDAAKALAQAPRPSTKDDKYQIRATAFAALPMTEAQASRVNAAVGEGRDPTPYLSPRQCALLDRLSRLDPSRRSILIGEPDLAFAWSKAEMTVR
jgi:hypothetical protein